MLNWEEKPQSRLFSHLILWITFAFVVSVIVWAKQAELEEVTRGEGKVIPSSQIQVVQNLEGGIVAELLIKEGDKVSQGQVLLRIDDTRFSSSFRENQLTAEGLQASMARLQAETQGVAFKLPADLGDKKTIWQAELALFKIRQQSLKTSISVLKQQKMQKSQARTALRARQKQLKRSYQLANKELKITAPLVAQGVMSEVELLRLQREVNELKGEEEAARLDLPRAKAALDEVTQKIKAVGINFRSEALSELNQYTAQHSRLSESGLALEDRVTRTAVRSPVNGTVKQLKVNTVGGVVQPGMDLVEIVPLDDGLLIEAKIRPADIAFLRPGQQAMVKFTAYDFSIFGGLTAELEHISADSLSDQRGETYFLIRLRTRLNYLGQAQKSLPIIPGMTVNVDILTGTKTVLAYMLKPLNRVQERALRER